ncbi:hypothetical protein [Pyxidicoccus caerfyrddinensis]|uniref:hypothetical protein n=1 Tax=Pyxidicoccus caerfyrddinensis TaxID=2709663 RepID=UPI0013DC7B16|nr:hypothetical protein [Pyxidicoccus caerfyrddinensis]
MAVLVLSLTACESSTRDTSAPGEDASLGSRTFALPDALQEYAQQCDQAIGVTVPDFSCENGTIVPTKHHVAGKCDQPNRLNRECDPNSRFQVLSNTTTAFVVAHCRKRGLGAGRYGDIAVIQYNKKNGATCFYQALGDLDGNVKAPSQGTAAWTWLPPSQTANINCAGCHDNGPLIRSPYLTQVTGANALPGKGDYTFNSKQPYRFIGADFASWKAYKVEVAGNPCLGCHRMATNHTNGTRGTALDLGIRATAVSEDAKNPHSPDSPIWMMPGQVSFSQASADAAAAIKACALRKNEVPLPDSASCRITQFSGVRPLLGPGNFTAAWAPSTHSEIELIGATFEDYQEKDSQLRGLGWRLRTLQPFVVDGQLLYNAVWKEGTEGELPLYGASPEDFRARHDGLSAQGWRLKLLQPYVLEGRVLYTAVWQPSSEAEVLLTGVSPGDFRARHDALSTQGWRLKLLQPYVVDGQVLYTAVWRPSTEPELLLDGASPADFRARYDALRREGWRLKLLEPYVVRGLVSYTAVLRQDTTDELQVYDLNSEDFSDRHDELWEQGWRLKFVRAW